MLNLIDIPSEIDVKLLGKVADAAFEYLGGDFEVNLKFVPLEEMRGLNRTFRDKDEPTDILSFNLELDSFDGDLAITESCVKDDAMAWNLSLSEATSLLLAHGMLHLAGYDHTKFVDRDKMEKAEAEILKKAGININR